VAGEQPALVAWRRRGAATPTRGATRSPTPAEEPVAYGGRVVQARVFSRIGLVVWLPEAGAKVVGWPR
jgi:hypothetical protein